MALGFVAAFAGWVFAPGPVMAREPSPPRDIANSESPFAPNEEIERLAREVRAVPGGTRRKLDAVVETIFSRKGGLGFAYRSRPTLTAAAALAARQGNCLSLVNLFVSLSRAAGLDAVFVRVEDFEAFYLEGEAVVRSTHVIGAVKLDGQLLTVDFLPDRPKRYRRLQEISDRRATAYYHNAVATEAMLAGDDARAAELFRAAIDVEPEFAETWNNLGVLLYRQGDLEGAVEALERAHRLDSTLLPALENLSGLYRGKGRVVEAAELDRLAMELRTRNPYYLLQQGLLALESADLDRARELLERARQLDAGIPQVYLGLGRVELAEGRRRQGERMLAKARDLSESLSAGIQGRVQSKIDRLLAEADAEERPGGADAGDDPGDPRN